MGSADLTTYRYLIASFDQLSTAPWAGGKYGAVTGLNRFTVDKISKPDAVKLFDQVSGFSVNQGTWTYASYTPESNGTDSRFVFGQNGLRGISASNVGYIENPRPNWGYGYWQCDMPSLVAGKTYALKAQVSSLQGGAIAKTPEFRLRVNTANSASVWGFQSNADVGAWAPTLQSDHANKEYETFFRIPSEGPTGTCVFSFDMIVGLDRAVPRGSNEVVGVTLEEVSLRVLRDLPAVTMLTPDTSRVTPIFPTFKFNRLNESALMVTSYTLEVSSNSSFNGSYTRAKEIAATNSAGGTVTLDWDDPLERGRTYYWRVKAHDVFDQSSSGAASKQFKVGAGAQLILGEVIGASQDYHQVDLQTGSVVTRYLDDDLQFTSAAFDPLTGNAYLLLWDNSEQRARLQRGNLVSGGDYSFGAPQSLSSDASEVIYDLAFSPDGVLWAMGRGDSATYLAWVPKDGGSVTTPWGTDVSNWEWRPSPSSVFWLERSLAWSSGQDGNYLYGVSPENSSGGIILKFGPVAFNHGSQTITSDSASEIGPVSSYQVFPMHQALDGGGVFGPDGKMVVPNVAADASSPGTEQVILYRFDPTTPTSYSTAAIPLGDIGDEAEDWSVAITLDVTTAQLDGLFSTPGRPSVTIEENGGSPRALYAEAHPLDVKPVYQLFKVRYASNPPSGPPALTLNRVSGTGTASVALTMYTASGGGYEKGYNLSSLNIQGEAEYAVMVDGVDRGHIRISNGAPSLSIDSTPKIVR